MRRNQMSKIEVERIIDTETVEHDLGSNSGHGGDAERVEVESSPASDGTKTTEGTTQTGMPGANAQSECSRDGSRMPTWDKSNPSESLRCIGSWFNDEARRSFLKYATHTEMFFLYKDDGQGGMLQPPRDMDRDTFVKVFKNAIRQNDIFGVVHIVEAWTYAPRSLNDHAYKQILDGEIMIAELKAEDRAETLVVRYECRNGNQNIWFNPIMRTKDGGVALQDSVIIEDKMGGRFGSLFGDSQD